MKEFIIPVAFDVTVEDDAATEIEAAKVLAEVLDRVRVLEHTASMPGTLAPMNVDSWWMPNHPAADRSDHEAVLIWIPLMSYAGRVTENETPQQSVDQFLRVTQRWMKGNS